MEEGPLSFDDWQPLPSVDGPHGEDRTMSKRTEVRVDMHAHHAFNLIYAPSCLPSYAPQNPLPSSAATPELKCTTLDPSGTGVSCPLPHYRPPSTASGQRAGAVSAALGGKAHDDGPSGTPFALLFPLIARHGHGTFTLLSMREAVATSDRLSLVDCRGLGV